MTELTVLADPRATLARLKLPEDFEPAWELLSLFPGQGEWTDDAYLTLGEKLETRRLIELVNGRLEVLQMPTEEHQLIVGFLYRMLFAAVDARKLGTALSSPFRVRMRSRHFREPDVIFLSRTNAARRGRQFWRGADLVMEVVSEDDPDRDYVQKRREYARAGIREYWIVDPRDHTITLLLLKGKAYVDHGTFRDGQTVTSVLLPDFSAAVSDVFDSAAG